MRLPPRVPIAALLAFGVVDGSINAARAEGEKDSRAITEYFDGKREDRSVQLTQAQFAEPSQTIGADEIERFVGKYLDANNAMDVKKLVNLFAESADYYSAPKNVDRKFIRDDKRKFFERWPKVNYKRHGSVSIAEADKSNERLVTFGVAYRVYSPARESSAQGTATKQLVVRMIDGELKIVSIKETVKKR